MKTQTPAIAPAVSPVNLAALAASLAAALSGYVSASVGYAAQWTAKPLHGDTDPDSNHHLIRADGLTLFLAGSRGGWAAKGRVTVSLSRAVDSRHQYVDVYDPVTHSRISNPEITVAETKSPEAIAADITRRLLPDAERVHALVMERIASDTAFEDCKLALLRECATAAGLPDVPRDHYSKDQPVFSFYLTDQPGDTDRAILASVKVNGSKAQIEVDAGPGQASALIAFLRSPAYLSAGTPATAAE